MNLFRHVYFLICPITGNVRYVGQTKNPGLRMITHKRTKFRGNDLLFMWILWLKIQNKAPIFQIIKSFDLIEHDKVNFWERFYIKDGIRKGWPLLNIKYSGRSWEELSPIFGELEKSVRELQERTCHE